MGRYIVLWIMGAMALAQQLPLEDSIAIATKLQVDLGLDVPAAYKTDFLYAYAAYPELQDLRIKFKAQRIKTTLSCRPSMGAVFRKTRKRKYIIRINSRHDSNSVNLRAVPFHARVGVWGHELAHIHDYNSKSGWGLIATGWKYLFHEQRSALEKQVDEITVSHGLGLHLLEWKKYLYCCSGASASYLNYKSRVYYSEAELKEVIELQGHTP